jgi:PAS domain S-box-containing protein
MTLVAAVIGGITLHYVQERLVATTGESLSLAAADVADKLDRLLFERYGDVQMMAQALGARFDDRRYMTAYVSRMRDAYSPMYLWLGVTDAQGRVIAATDPATLGQDEGQSRWFEALRKGDDIHVGDVEPYETAGGVDAVAFSAPIRGPGGTLLGAVTTRVAIPVLEDVVARTIRAFEAREKFLGKIEYLFLTREGLAFVDSDLLHKGGVNLRQLGIPSAALSESGRPGYVEETARRRNTTVVTGYALTQGYGSFEGLRWTVLVRMDRSDILAPVFEVLWKLGLAGAVLWLPMFGLLLWASKRVRQEYLRVQQESERATAAEAATRESEQRFRTLASQAPVGIFMTDALGDCLFVNRRWSEIAGLSLEEAKERGWVRALHPDDRERVFQEWYEVAKQGRQFASEYRFQRPDGTVTYLEGSAVGVVGAAREITAYIGTIVDITVRKQAESRQAAQLAVSLALTESETLSDAAPKLLQAVCDTMGWELGAIWRHDRVAHVLRCETVWHVPTISVEEFVTLSRARTFSLGVGLPGRVWEGARPAWIPDVVKDPNFPRAPVAAKVGLHAAFGFPILFGQDVLGVLEFFSRDIREPDQALLDMMADIGIKIGEFIVRKQTEVTLRHTEAQLHHAQKMEALGQFAGGIAHDFNNLLMVIKGYSQLLLDRLAAGDSHRADIEEIYKAGDRASTLTNKLLAFSRRQVLRPTVLDLNEVVSGIETMLRRLIGEDVDLIVAQAPNLGRIKADPSQLEQVIVNLAVNARDAMPEGGRLKFETANWDLDALSARLHGVERAGRYVMLSVEDTGCGMDAQTQARVFEPFFTTKERGKGTGLGLSTVYGIVEQSGGFIALSSEPAKGTVFKVGFPRVDETGAPVPQAPPTAEVPRGTETVLLVEDEPAIRSLLAGALRQVGYRVLEAKHGVEALLIGSQHDGSVELLLTDVVMPQMNGRELAEQLVKVRPGLKVLYMSAYTDDAVILRGVVQSGAAFLQKPFTLEALARRVREVLDAR